MPGRLPVPTKIKILRGNPGQRRIKGGEPEFTPAKEDPPCNLQGAALALWKELVPQFIQFGTMRAVDRDEVALGCELRAKGREEFARGSRMAHALVMLKHSSLIFARYGVGASDRTRITVNDAPKVKSKWQGLVGNSQDRAS